MDRPPSFQTLLELGRRSTLSTTTTIAIMQRWSSRNSQALTRAATTRNRQELTTLPVTLADVLMVFVIIIFHIIVLVIIIYIITFCLICLITTSASSPLLEESSHLGKSRDERRDVYKLHVVSHQAKNQAQPRPARHLLELVLAVAKEDRREVVAGAPVREIKLGALPSLADRKSPAAVSRARWKSQDHRRKHAIFLLRVPVELEVAASLGREWKINLLSAFHQEQHWHPKLCYIDLTSGGEDLAVAPQRLVEDGNLVSRSFTTFRKDTCFLGGPGRSGDKQVIAVGYVPMASCSCGPMCGIHGGDINDYVPDVAVCNPRTGFHRELPTDLNNTPDSAHTYGQMKLEMSGNHISSAFTCFAHNQVISTPFILGTRAATPPLVYSVSRLASST
ncbi:hypothetical protein SELMODRAFT_427923 [Selaginella moellendorffii]|uniref:Uncharacterized protein n=1 Tax=Selaginella moellendorffii TaxID=88036 RepID=D8T149_SELML|nr:hypothetical protein SELMODRAFT_427923 [Selaginella moellendorffii]